MGIYGSVHRPLVKTYDSSQGTVPYEIVGKVGK